MENKDLAKYIAGKYRASHLVEQFGEGDLTDNLVLGLESVVSETLDNLPTIPNLGQTEEPGFDFGVREEANHRYGDIVFTPKDVFVEGIDYGDTRGYPREFKPNVVLGRALKFLLERPGKRFTRKEIGKSLGCCIESLSGRLDLVGYAIDRSKEYEWMGDVPFTHGARYGVSKINGDSE